MELAADFASLFGRSPEQGASRPPNKISVFGPEHMREAVASKSAFAPMRSYVTENRVRARAEAAAVLLRSGRRRARRAMEACPSWGPTAIGDATHDASSP